MFIEWTPVNSIGPFMGERRFVSLPGARASELGVLFHIMSVPDCSANFG
jgi:hypothetical protein